MYGSDYHNSTYFVGAHDFNAAWIESDHIHEGLGTYSLSHNLPLVLTHSLT